MRIRARDYRTGEKLDLHYEDGSILSRTAPSAERPDVEAGWVAPALFDLQINGCVGHGFSSERLSVGIVADVVAACRRHGIGELLPTVITNSYSALHHSLTILRRACENDRQVGRAVPGFHLEGPYISSEDGARGAHPREHVRPPDWDEFCRLQEAAGGRIRLVTLAPEWDRSLDFIERLVHAGIVVALGHTLARGARIRDAISAGARLSTHLGNGCPALLPRHENMIWEQLAADELWCSLICDGHHLPAAVVKCMLAIKTPRRTILTCDASSLAGLPSGRYREWDQDLEILPEGKVVVADTPYLAGSWAFTDQCVGNVMRYSGIGLGDALDMAGARPRELLRLPRRTLEPGASGDLLLFDWDAGGDLQVKRVLS